jgi:hypothetical protein
VLSTNRLLNSPLRYGKGDKSRNYDIPLVAPILFQAESALPVHPYLLGVLLGDGCLKLSTDFSSTDSEIAERLQVILGPEFNVKKRNQKDYRVVYLPSANQNPLTGILHRLGVRVGSKDKFVPRQFLLASPEQRFELLRGLMDTDGYSDKSGCCQFYTISPQLAEDVLFLIRSLGAVPKVSIKHPTFTYKGEKRNGQPCFVLTFSIKTGNPFWLKRKAKRWNATPRDNGRWIDRIEFESVQPTICISVESPDQSYLTENFIVTHNSPMQLVWAENVTRYTNKPVLVITPLAVSTQILEEAEKFGIEAVASRDGQVKGNIIVTNYERLHLFDANQFIGAVCDESSILKSFDGVRRNEITDFMRKLPYRLLCTATAAPNDYVELGTSSEALGYLGHMDMLARFFVNRDKNSNPRGGRRYRFSDPGTFGNAGWRFKGHAEQSFWRWVCSWARAMRRPSDLGFDDSRFALPELIQHEHLVQPRSQREGFLFEVPAIGLREEREEQRRTLVERCEKVAELVSTGKPAVAWCHLNAEGDLLAKLLPDAVQVKGSDSLEHKEEALLGFSKGAFNTLISKPKITAWGLNWQHCAHTTFFPSHSFEQFYQAVRRFWRFGQTQPVRVDIVTTSSGHEIMQNLQRKSAQADTMFSSLVAHMNNALTIERSNGFHKEVELPNWL